jgi:hypothetical protein
LMTHFNHPVSCHLLFLCAVTDTAQKNRSQVEQYLEKEHASKIIVAVLTVLAFIVRFVKLNHPDQVV